MMEEKRETTKPFQVKLYPEEIERFRLIKGEMDDANTDRAALLALMDFFENPKTVKVDNPQHLERISQLEGMLKESEAKAAALQEKVSALTNESNHNAAIAAAVQLQLDSQPRLSDNQIIIEVHPFVLPFLRRMAEKTKKTMGYVLANLFWEDLQNPMANNLPFTVSRSEISEQIELWKKQQAAARKEAENV